MPESQEPVHTDNPVLYLSPLATLFSEITDDADRGILPYPGSMADQPARLTNGIRWTRRARAHVRELLSRAAEPMGGAS